VRTAKDWLAEGALAEAEAAARYADDLTEVAAAWRARGRTDEARRVLDLAIARADGAHWSARGVAKERLALCDRDGAHAALATIEAALRAPRYGAARARDWAQLADAYRAVLGDEGEVARCLAIAADHVVDADDRAELAAARLELAGDRDGARAELERAEASAFAEGPLRAAWTISNRWRHAMGDPDRARDVLVRAIAAAADPRDATAFAIAWRSAYRDGDDGVRAALARAEAIAQGAEAWLVVAEAYRDGGDTGRVAAWDRAGVARALERAAVCDPDPDQRNRIASGFRRWLGDDARAQQITPAAAPVGAAAQALFDLVRARIEATALRAIASADYGMDYPKHHASLDEIHATGVIPRPLDWYPREVVELTRWSEGDATDHVARTFACVILAIDAATPGTRQIGVIADVLGPLVESAGAAGLDDALDAFLVELTANQGEQVAAWASLALAIARVRRGLPAATPTAPRRDRAITARLWRTLADAAGDPALRAMIDAAIEGE
jgi:hypothetical protein